jgi:lysophospholipase L1-like esterase
MHRVEHFMTWARVALLVVALAVVGATGAARAVDGLLLVGDSWAEQQWDDQAHSLVFDAVGQTGVAVYGAATAESGTTAADWVQPGRLQRLVDELALRDDVDVVQLTLGGNDFLDAWSTALTPAEEAALVASVRADLATLLETILGQRPDVEVLLSFYDYPNFVDTLGGVVGLFFCAPLWSDLGQPDPFQLNTASTEFEQVVAALAATHPRVFHVSHLGLMQSQFGFPSDGIPPGQLSPPGDLALPSPVEALRLGGDDCFHLNAEGYDGLVLNQYDGYFEDRFEVIFRSQFR